MKLKIQRMLLLLCVRFFHRGQYRKYSKEKECYYHHTVRVAKAADKYYPKLNGYEIGLCHDLLEDTKCTSTRLYDILRLLCYKPIDVYCIIEAVNDLTDLYTKEYMPSMNRSQRKCREALRLSQCPEIVQTIKYCDFEDNTKSIVKHEPKFAKIYLREKRYALNLMMEGDRDLRDKLIEETGKYTELCL